MAFVIVFWTTYIPFVILVLSLGGRYAMRALRGPRFERSVGGDGASPTLSIRRPASAYISRRSLSTSCLTGAQNAKTILGVVVGYSLDEARQHFLGRRFRLRTHAH